MIALTVPLNNGKIQYLSAENQICNIEVDMNRYNLGFEEAVCKITNKKSFIGFQITEVKEVTSVLITGTYNNSVHTFRLNGTWKIYKELCCVPTFIFVPANS